MPEFYFILYQFSLVFLRHGFTVTLDPVLEFILYPRLALNSQRSACLCLPKVLELKVFTITACATDRPRAVTQTVGEAGSW